jgi:hypothetical protein
MNVILDPQGSLFFGSKHVIPFDLTDADVYADVIVLCPLPQVLDFTLETPSGKVITPSTGGPNVEYKTGPQVAFYRVTLPALAADPAGSHAGKWKAILSIKSKREIEKLLKNREFAAAFRSNAIAESVPYSLVAHAYSNLQFDATLEQDSLKPGAGVILQASLKEYDVPFAADAAVWAEITKPDSSTMNLKLERVSAGVYSAAFTASSPGVYLCRVRAEGYCNSKDKFTREKTLTAAVYYGDYGTTPGKGDTFCELLHCLTSDKVLSGRALQKLREIGIDLKALTDCLEAHCPEMPSERTGKPVEAAYEKRAQAEPRINIKSERASQPVKTPKAKPAKVGEMTERDPEIGRMFNLPSAAERKMAMSKKGARKGAGVAQPVVFPRIVRMFSRPEEEVVEAGEKTAPKKPSKKMAKDPKRGR